MLLQVSNLSIGYDNKPLKKDISFSLTRGEVLLIKGDNGSGKTTLVNTLLNEQKSLKGSIQRNFGTFQYLKQNCNRDINFPITVQEILGSSNCSYPEKKWSQLSGGERQQVLIEKALQEKSDLLILDEPFNHIDKDSIKKIEQILAREVKNQNLAIILISHISLSNTLEVKELIL